MALSLEVIAAIIERVRAGEKLLTIAKDYAVSKQAISEYLIAHSEPEYREAQEQALEDIVNQLEKAIQEAPTMTDIARAREAAKIRMWHLERRYPHLYGNRQIIQGDKDSDPVQVQVVDYTKPDSE